MKVTTNRRLWLLVAGCGTAGYHGAEAVCRDDLLPEHIDGITLADRDTIDTNNALTCPGYAGHADRPKTQRLQECIEGWLGGRRLHIERRGRVEQIDYASFFRAQGPEPPVVCGLMGLDCWEPRVALTRGLRTAAADAGQHAWIIQSAFDRGGAQVTVMRERWKSPCPVCAVETLPQEEPCVVLRRAEEASMAQGEGDSPIFAGAKIGTVPGAKIGTVPGAKIGTVPGAKIGTVPGATRLLRGDLLHEARAAAGHVVRVLRAVVLGYGDDYADTKTELILDRSGGVQCYTRPKHYMPACWGPHDPARRPLSQGEIFR